MHYLKIPMSSPLLEFSDLNALAMRLETTPEAIAQQIVAAGYPAGIARKTGAYLGSIDGINALLDAVIEREVEAYRDRRRKELLAEAIEEADGVVRVKTAARRRHFKSFKKFGNTEQTLGKFLDAQKWDAPKRIAFIEALGNLKERPGAPGEEEQAIEFICKTCSMPGARKDIIAAARKMQGLSQG